MNKLANQAIKSNKKPDYQELDKKIKEFFELHRGYPSKVIIHSDLVNIVLMITKILTAYGLKCSMNRKGNCWDNAVAESSFYTLKTE